MFKRIMVPIDLHHIDRQMHALDCAGDLAKLYDAHVIIVSATSSVPTDLAHTPAEYSNLLNKFVAEQAERLGIQAEAQTKIAHDVRTELDDVLLRSVDETKADLVVMASHDPGFLEYIWPSNGGKIASHAHASVLVVR